jgi:hypothetical protein
MSIGPLGNVTTVAGIQLAQTTGSELDRVHREVGAQRHKVYHERKAEAATGVGEADGENHEITDRDGDGRRSWEDRPDTGTTNATRAVPRSVDPSHQSGNLLDLNG